MRTTTIPDALKKLLSHAQESLPSDPNQWNDYDRELVAAMREVTKSTHDDQNALADKQKLIDELCSYLDNIGTGLTNTAARHRSPPARHVIKLRSQTSLPIDKCL